MNNWCICWFFMHPLNGELNPICHLLALLGGATIVVVSRLRVNIHKIYILTAESISEFHTVLMTNSGYLLIQLSLIGFMTETSTVHCAAQTEYLLNMAV